MDMVAMAKMCSQKRMAEASFSPWPLRVATAPEGRAGIGSGVSQVHASMQTGTI